MVESVATEDVCVVEPNQSIVKEAKLEKRPHKLNQTKSKLPLAPLFKYQFNWSRQDIDEIRRLLTKEREKQHEEEYEFYTPDYERFMKDDWLVTRFLLRGFKAAQKQNDQSSNQSASKDKLLGYACTMELIGFCAKFRYEFQVSGLTKLSEFPLDWTQTNGLFNYKPDRVGNPTVYLRTKLHRPKLIETETARYKFKRYLLYTLEQCDQNLYNKPGKAICCIFDMTDGSFDNVDLELMSWMIKSFKSSSPKLVCYVIIYNPAWYFTATFRLIFSTLLSDSKRQSVRFVCADEILNYIDYDNLPDYIRSSIC